MPQAPQYNAPQMFRGPETWNERLAATASDSRRHVKAEGCRTSTVRIKQKQRNKANLGSGVIIRHRGYVLILTAGHVIESDTTPVTVRYQDGRTTEASVLYTDRTWDAAVLLPADEPATGIYVGRLAFRETGTFPAGAALQGCGFGMDEQFAVISGRFVQYTKPAAYQGEETDWLVMSGGAEQGDSGGPIFNAQGEVVGLVNATDGQRVIGVQCGRLHVCAGEACKKLPGRRDNSGTIQINPVVPQPIPTQPPTDLAPITSRLDRLTDAIEKRFAQQPTKVPKVEEDTEESGGRLSKLPLHRLRDRMEGRLEDAGVSGVPAHVLATLVFLVAIPTVGVVLAAWLISRKIKAKVSAGDPLLIERFGDFAAERLPGQFGQNIDALTDRIAAKIKDRVGGSGNTPIVIHTNGAAAPVSAPVVATPASQTPVV
jgi:hypothetical protein